MNDFPIGIFDSGIGGLSVWQEILELLPQESTIYVGDSGHAPYGKLSVLEIYDLSRKITTFLLEHKAKMIVIACNTATVSCLDLIRSDFPHIPIIGTVPVVKTAAAVTKNSNIGVLVTGRASESHYLKHLIEEFTLGHTVITVGTNALVPFIEKGETTSPEFLEVLKKEVQPFIDNNVDTVVLGSTHFAFIEQQIRDILGEDVQFLHSGAPVARQVKRVLEHNQTLGRHAQPTHVLHTTGDVDVFRTTAKKLIKPNASDKIKAIKGLII